MDSLLHSLPRRALLAGVSAFAASAALAPFTAHAKAPASLARAPAFYRFKVGDITAISVSDGPLALGDPTQVISGPKEDINALLTESFLPTGVWSIDQNAVVLITGGSVVLFDTGMGTSKIFGDTAGRLIANLQAAGIAAGDVDHVIISHAHPDHCWGLMANEGAGPPNFPNAQIHISQADFDFWTDEAKASINDMMKTIIGGTRPQLLPNRARMRFFKDGQEIVPGVQAMATPGHTVGHTSFMIASGGQTLCLIADIAHHYVLSLARPRFAFGFDTDPQQGIATRVRLFDTLAVNRTQLLGYHFPWPGIGHVAKVGDAYHFIATPMDLAGG